MQAVAEVLVIVLEDVELHAVCSLVSIVDICSFSILLGDQGMGHSASKQVDIRPPTM